MNNSVEMMLFASGGIIILAMILMFYRFIKGPHLVDRVIAFDVMTVASLGFIALLSVFLQREMYLDVNIIYGLLSFTSVIVVGKYVEKKL